MRRVALVVGGAGGIGRACVEDLRSRGWRVATIDLLDSADISADFTVGGVDASDPVALERAIAASVASLGRPEAWIYAAGIAEVTPIDALTVEAWRRLHGVNVDGQLHLARAALSRRAEGPTTLIGVTSTAGLLARAEDEAYSATKAAATALMRGIGGRYATEDVLAVAVCPGPVDTPLLRGALDRCADREAALRRLETATAIGRLIAPSEIAELIGWICERRPFVFAAAALPADGGKSSVLPLHPDFP